MTTFYVESPILSICDMVIDSVLSTSLNLVLTVVKQVLFTGRNDKYVKSTSPLFEIIFPYSRLEVISSRGSNIILFLCCFVWQYFPLILLQGWFISNDTCTNINKVFP